MPLIIDLPTSAEDPRLERWRHTIELGDGLLSKGEQDLRTVVDRFGLPDSLEGKTALDVGTADGFWAFEMERRGAEKVMAVDVGRAGELDWAPRARENAAGRMQKSFRRQFDMAHLLLESHVEHRVLSVYDLAPATVGTWTFDVVFCAGLLPQLQNPIQALLSIRSVTREKAIISVPVDETIEREHPGLPWLVFGDHEGESVPGEAGTYWRFSSRGLQEIMDYCGFVSTEALEPIELPDAELRTAIVIGYR
jgi:tRNA (mo5U34)-methyltransferase